MKILFHSIGVLIALVCVLVLAGVPFDLRSQVVFATVLLLSALIVNRFPGERAVHVLILITVLVSTRYLWWRATHTLAFDDTWSAVAGYTLFAAEVYAYIVLVLGFVQSIRPLRRQPIALPADVSCWPTVDIFIPTYIEPLSVVSATVAAAKNLEWPADKLRIYLLDDGNRPEFKRFARQAGIQYRARQSNRGAKAGNLNAALEGSQGEYIAIFDCDQVPVRSFLQLTIGWFLKDDRLAQLQTPQFFHTADPVERSLGIEGKVPNEGSLFYGLIQDGNDLWDASFFCGSCAVLKRQALREIGGIAEQTLTEDAHTGLRLHRHGYTSAYINEVQAAGLATESLAAHINQRIRWARGLAQVFRIDNPFVGGGLSLWQRLCYANATMHFLYAAPRLIFLIAPVFFLFFNLSVIKAEAAMVAIMALPHIVHSSLTNARMSGCWRHAFWAEVYETVLSFYLFFPTLVALLAPSRGRFNVTRKGFSNEANHFNFRLARPFIALGLLNLAAVVVGLYRYLYLGTAEPSTTWLNLVWAGYNLTIIGVAMAVAYEKRQTRGFQRHALNQSVWLRTTTGKRLLARVIDISESGLCVRLDAPYAESGLNDQDIAVTHVALTGQAGLVSMPLKTVSFNSGLLRAQFDEVDFETYRELIGLLFSPADRWSGVRENFRRSGMISSLVAIVLASARGWMRLVASLGQPTISADADTASTRHVRVAGSSALVLLLCIVGGLLVSNSSQAAESIDYELRRLTDRTDTEIELGLVRYGMDIPFSVRRDMVVNSGELALVVSWKDHSTVERQTLQIGVNGQTLWRSTGPVGEMVQIRVPFDGVLLGEFNQLTLTLMGTDSNQCGAGAGESFIVTLHESSSIRMDVTSIPIANDLETLPLPFLDDRDPRMTTIGIVLPDTPSNPVLLAAGRLAGLFGTLASYRGVQFDVHTGELPPGDALVLAAGPDLPHSLQWLDSGAPRVLLLDGPDGPDQQLLVITAPDDTGLDSAIDELFDRMPSDAFVRSGPSSTLERQSPAVPHRWMNPELPVRLDALSGIGPQSLAIVNNDFTPIEARFQISGDLIPSDNEPYRLSLGYHYEPNFPEFKEELIVSFNGRDLRRIDLERLTTPEWWKRVQGVTQSKSGFSGHVDIALPPELLQVENRLEFRFTAPAEIASGCGDHEGVEVRAGIDGASVLDFSNSHHHARYPDLALTVNAGLPFTSRPDLSGTHVQLPNSPAPHHYAMYMSLMARFAAITGNEPSGISVSSGPSTAPRDHQILIAATNTDTTLNAALAKSPLEFSGERLLAEFSSWTHTYTALNDWVLPPTVVETLQRVGQDNSAERSGVLVSSGLTGTDQGVLLMLVANTRSAATAVQKALMDSATIRTVRGSAVIASDTSVHALETGRPLSIGQLPFLRGTLWWFSQNIGIALLLALLGATAFALAMPGILDRRAARRLHSSD